MAPFRAIEYSSSALPERRTTTDPEDGRTGIGPGPAPNRAVSRWRRLGVRERKVLLLLSVADLFDTYDSALVSIALKQIQDGLAIPDAELGTVQGAIRLGMLASFVVTLFADRFGRRRLLLVTLVGFSFFTFVTAFAQTSGEFVIAQLLARAFIGAEIMLASVVVVEELAARDRGFGLGLIGALGALGYGLAALAFAFVDVLPGGWRALYVAGALPLLFIAWMRRRLPETERFERHRRQRAARASLRETLRPLRSLLAAYPARLLGLSAFVFCFDFVHWPVFTFLPKTMQDVHGYSAWAVSTIVVVGGAIGIFGNVAAGIASDRVGRRAIIVALIALHATSSYVFYTSDGTALFVAWVGIAFAATGLGVLIKALGGELFPTSYRSTAAGVRLVAATLGGVTGFRVQSAIYDDALATLGGAANAEQIAHAVALTWLLPLLVLAALLVLLVPETAGRELEDIAPERRDS